MNVSQFKFKKKYGQNFLVDNNIVKKIINTIAPLNNSLVIEVGCGDGRLTTCLCEKFDYVLGYEIDNEIKDCLLSNLKRFKNYNIVFDDFLKRDVLDDLKGLCYDNIYVVSNLPYYITTPIIEKIIDLRLDVVAMTFMVQKEVGDRFTALVGTKEYSSLSVYLNYYFDIKKDFIVGRNSFIPRPNVDSLVVTFKKHERLFVKNEKLFFKLVRDSFVFKRKTLKNNLINYDLKIVEKVLEKYNLDLNVRAEALSVNVFCDIANELSI